MGFYRILILLIIFDLDVNLVISQSFLYEKGHFKSSGFVRQDTLRKSEWIFWKAKQLFNDIRKGKLETYRAAEIEVNENQGYESISYRLEDRVKISFPDGCCLLFALHSYHEDAQLGDIVLAVDSEGNSYIQDEHVCGGLAHFVRRGSQLPENCQQFTLEFTGQILKNKWTGIRLHLRK